MSNQIKIENMNVSGGGTWDTSTFPRRGPKADYLAAVKLTYRNIRDIAGHILEAADGVVEVDDNVIRLGPPSPVDGRPTAGQFLVGDWLVKEYDYANDVDVFRYATLGERQKYDLR